MNKMYSVSYKINSEELDENIREKLCEGIGSIVSVQKSELMVEGAEQGSLEVTKYGKNSLYEVTKYGKNSLYIVKGNIGNDKVDITFNDANSLSEYLNGLKEKNLKLIDRIAHGLSQMKISM